MLVQGPFRSRGLPSAQDILREAFSHQDALTAYAYTILQDWGFAQDAVQEAFIALHAKHGHYDGSATVFAWARGMVRFEALRIIRRRGRASLMADDQLLDLIDRHFDRYLETKGDEYVERKREALRRCMGKLGQDVVAMLVGFYRDAMSCDELAARHRRSANAVRLAMSRARARLRVCIERQLASEGEA